jgi:probable DNA metabolism protein
VIAVALVREDDLDGFREAVRGLIGADAAPHTVTWHVGESGDLFGGDAVPQSDAPISVPRAYGTLAETVICHRDPERFALLYEALWRIVQGERALLSVASDPLVHRLTQMEKAVRRDMHKMTAFVRFRRVEADGVERYVAWFEPEHHILRRVSDFFVKRFASMAWSILTPEGTIHWDGGSLAFGPGVPRDQAPGEDALEDWWLTYYRAIFNPARLHIDAMRAEMPKKYWRNLPEAELIPGLIAQAQQRTETMIDAAPTPARRAAAPFVIAEPTVAPDGSLEAVRAAATACERCPLFRDATQTVFGEGTGDAPVMFVGEQPGDQEDLAGRPFVGPAGQMFDRALSEAGIDRGRTYVTNAVKHFKFVPRGKRRIHQKPNSGEIEACRWWLHKEIGLVKPRLTVALGATAARALTGRDVTISRVRGQVMPMRDGLTGFITVHPSFLLRLPDAQSQAREYARFVADLRSVAAHLPEIRKAA